MKASVIIADTTADWITAGTDKIIALATQAIETRGEFSLVLAGGSTPRPVYEHLSSKADQIDWARSYIFWGDERCVPPNLSESNYRMAKESLLEHVPIPDMNVFRMLGELDPETAAQDYEGTLSAFFHQKEKRFDVVLLGLGDDGHTASLFPETPALEEFTRWVTSNPHPYSDSTRLTLTYPALNNARQVIFLVTGENKSRVVADVIQNPRSTPDYPAKRVIGGQNLPIWILDAAAARFL